ISAPLFSSPSNGSPVSTFTPATTSELPILTLADPFAFFIRPTSISIGLISSRALPSSLFPFEIESHICCLRKCSTIIVERLDELIVLPSTRFRYQSTFALMPAFEFHKPYYNHLLPYLDIH